MAISKVADAIEIRLMMASPITSTIAFTLIVVSCLIIAKQMSYVTLYDESVVLQIECF